MRSIRESQTQSFSLFCMERFKFHRNSCTQSPLQSTITEISRLRELLLTVRFANYLLDGIKTTVVQKKSERSAERSFEIAVAFTGSMKSDRT